MRLGCGARAVRPRLREACACGALRATLPSWRRLRCRRLIHRGSSSLTPRRHVACRSCWPARCSCEASELGLHGSRGLRGELFMPGRRSHRRWVLSFIVKKPCPGPTHCPGSRIHGRQSTSPPRAPPHLRAHPPSSTTRVWPRRQCVRGSSWRARGYRPSVWRCTEHLPSSAR